MNAYTIKREKERYSTSYDSRLNIQRYGSDNLYPQRMHNLVLNSPTGSTCLERYQTFIEGNGLYDIAFSEFVCNRQEQTVDDVLRLVSADIAEYNGFALRIYYDLTCRITDIQHVPFHCCRLEEEDDNGKVPYIAYHVEWEGTKTRKGKYVKVDPETVRKFYRFNPIKEVILSQMKKDGVFSEEGEDITKYRGQILWVSLNGDNVYPRPKTDKIATNLSIDAGLDNIKYRNVRNNFLTSGVLVRKKGTGSLDNTELDEDGNPIDSIEDDEVTVALREFQGDDNACAIMEIEVASDEEIPQFLKFEGVNFDSKFTTTENSVTERIYSAFGQEPWYTLRIGKVGFSGDILAQAYEYYNSYVAPQRRVVSRYMKKIFSHWCIDEKAINPTLNYDIQPLVYVTNELSNI